MTKRTLNIAPVPLSASPRQGSSRGSDETPAGKTTSGRTFSVALVPLADRAGGSGRSLEPGRPSGWNTDFPELPGRGAQDDQPKEPAIKLAITRFKYDSIYYIDVQLMTRDDEVERAIHDHYIFCAVVTYLDTETRRAWENKRSALHEEKRAGYDSEGLYYFMSPQWMWVSAKQIFHSTRDTGLEVTVNSLLNGGMRIHSDDLAYIRDVERSILFSIDKIAMSIEVGLSFDNDETAIYAPGSAQKSRAKLRPDDTPPDEWGE